MSTARAFNCSDREAGQIERGATVFHMAVDALGPIRAHKSGRHWMLDQKRATPEEFIRAAQRHKAAMVKPVAKEGE